MNDDKSIQKPEDQIAKADAAVAPQVPVSQEQIALQADLEKYTKEINAVQAQMDALEAKKQELFRLGVRLEGVISYIKNRMGDAPKT